MEPITFHASIPAIQSAISIGGDRSSRVKLDIPATDVAEVVRLAGFATEKLLRITVEEAE